MDPGKSVSIIITYVNEYDFLQEAIHSAFAQLLPNCEIIIVCNSRIVERELELPQQILSRIRFIHEPIPGSSFARNTGLHHATGEWVQFLDVDDLLLPEKITGQMTHPEADIIVSPHTYKYLDGTMTPSRVIADDIWTGLLNSGLGSTSSMLFKKDAILKAGNWSSLYQSHQEYELLFRILLSGGNVVFVNNADTIVREREFGSLTQKTKPVRALEGIQLREEIWNYLRYQGMETPERKTAFLEYIFRQLRGLYRLHPEMAKKIYTDYFYYNKYTPPPTGIPFYNLMYRWLGFFPTEKFLRSYSVIRDRYLPFLPKNI